MADRLTSPARDLRNQLLGLGFEPPSEERKCIAIAICDAILTDIAEQLAKAWAKNTPGIGVLNFDETFHFRTVDDLAERIAGADDSEQDLIYHCLRAIENTDPEVACPLAICAMDLSGNPVVWIHMIERNSNKAAVARAINELA